MSKTNKTAILISCTDHYNERMCTFDKYFYSCGYETTYLASDFHHIRKEAYKCSVENATQFHVRPYKKNLSVDRILSHRDFAKAVYSYLEMLPQEPDFIVSEVPPNFLVKYLAKYKKKHPKVKLVIDLFDLWPETFPSSSLKKLLAPGFKIWKSLRDCHLSSANLITTECNLYREVLKKQLNGLNAQTIYMCRPKATVSNAEFSSSSDYVELCYLGSIGNIIDIEAIGNLISEITKHKKVRVHIIGEGESRDSFIEKLRISGSEVEFHGKIYDAAEKQRIFDICHFGINMMKSSVCIGLTMKSLDYFAAGLPILNNIGGDTEDLVNKYKIGLNIPRENLAETAELIAKCADNENNEMRKSVIKLFEQEFCEDVVLKKLKAAIDIIGECENA